MLNAIAVVAISLALFTAAGTGLLSCLGFRDVLRDPRAAPLGAAVIALLATPAAAAGPLRTGAWWVLAVVAVVVVAGVTRRRLAGDRPGGDPGGEPVPAVVLACAGAAGLVALVPLLIDGGGGILQVASHDVWCFVGTADWLFYRGLDVPLTIPPDFPLFEWSAKNADLGQLPLGLEATTGVLMTLTGATRSYTVMGPLEATLFVLSACGWLHLARAVFTGLSTRRMCAVAVAGGIGPGVVMAMTHGHVPNLFGLALFAFAVGESLRLAREPRPRLLVTAACGVAGAVTVYSSLLPWLIVGTLVAAVAGGRAPVRHPGRRSVPWPLTWVALVAAAGVVGAFGAWRAYGFARAASDAADTFVPVVGLGDYAALFAGTFHELPAPGVHAGPWRLAATVAVLLAAAGVCAWAARTRRGGVGVALATALTATTVLLIVHYERVGDAGYPLYKAALTGGAVVLPAVAVTAIGSLDARHLVPWLAVVVAIVVPAAGSLVLLTHLVRDPHHGIRQDLRAVIDTVAGQPAGQTLLLEGADAGTRPGEPAALFDMRMAAAYGLTRNPAASVEGLNTTITGVSPMGQHSTPLVRPATAWTTVLSSRPGPFGAGRRVQRRFGGFTLSAAPVSGLDATDYGVGWSVPHRVDDRLAQDVHGDNEILVSNAGSAGRVVTLTLRARGLDGPARLTLSAWRAPGRTVAVADRWTTVALRLPVPAGGVAPVSVAVPGTHGISVSGVVVSEG